MSELRGILSLWMHHSSSQEATWNCLPQISESRHHDSGGPVNGPFQKLSTLALPLSHGALRAQDMATNPATDTGEWHAYPWKQICVHAAANVAKAYVPDWRQRSPNTERLST
eukprot:CAMPEP_0172727036 /NCGR_PEP_ID=MMETSP1074-20121228/91454_1 /TAXON_ID=2916 /ORGANISM="Ceratium fusus, Strain PA161109" /LENGTH=111 /DNA_ID=CAMNT_0013554151 /DNA_START=452 /DNA_END=787 /DNA_ORIENTATION=-